MRLDYLLLDVFTSERLTGNPLAVVLKADGLLDDQMQRIAAEFNLSETVFITRPKAERHAAALRIFTPRVELPFGGHPTVGAAVAIGLDGKASVLRLEEQVGVVTAVIERIDRRTGHARFALPQLPEPAGKPPDRLHAAQALGIEPEQIGCGRHAMSVYSAGSLFYLVPVRDSLVLRQLRPNAVAWAEAFPLGRHNVYIYTLTPEEANNDLAARKFALGLGLEEDPATGSAAAALLGELAVGVGDGLTEYRLRQGVEMGRPSQIALQLRKDGEALTHGSIGGHAVIVGQGTLDLGD